MTGIKKNYLIMYFTIRIANSVKNPEYINNLIFNKNV